MQTQIQLVNKKKKLIKNMESELSHMLGLKNKLKSAKSFYEHSLELITSSVEYIEEERVTYKNKMVKEALKAPREDIENLKKLQYLSEQQMYIIREKNELNNLLLREEL
jgi:hypothetical protein